MEAGKMIGILTLGVLGAFSFMQGTIVYAFKPGNGGPDCKHAIRIDTTMTAESNSCLTYTECDTGQSCIDGNVYNNCGPVGFVDAYCGDYTNGTWNFTTGRCEGGFFDQWTILLEWICGWVPKSKIVLPALVWYLNCR